MLNVLRRVSTNMNEIILDKKLRKFQVESILGHLQGGNYEFKLWFEQYRKIFEKNSKTITS